VLTPLIEFWEKIQVFMETGGDVLFAIFAVTLVMWTLILERMWYFFLVYPREARRVTEAWAARKDRSSWDAEQIRRQYLSEMSLKLNRSLSLIKTFVALCPLLGLLGTVTGMIEVFDIMAMVGSGNARAMASGVSLATIPTMAGMVAALSGVYFSHRLDRQARRKVAKVRENLALDRGETCAAA
jgi:biopolymer transport protein ExbB